MQFLLEITGQIRTAQKEVAAIHRHRDCRIFIGMDCNTELRHLRGTCVADRLYGEVGGATRRGEELAAVVEGLRLAVGNTRGRAADGTDAWTHRHHCTRLQRQIDAIWTTEKEWAREIPQRTGHESCGTKAYCTVGGQRHCHRSPDHRPILLETRGKPPARRTGTRTVSRGQTGQGPPDE